MKGIEVNLTGIAEVAAIADETSWYGSRVYRLGARLATVTADSVQGVTYAEATPLEVDSFNVTADLTIAGLAIG